jgi:hypothetical protein
MGKKFINIKQGQWERGVENTAEVKRILMNWSMDHVVITFIDIVVGVGDWGSGIEQL